MQISGVSGNHLPPNGFEPFLQCQECMNQIKNMKLIPGTDQSQVFALMQKALNMMQTACGPNGGQQGVCADWMTKVQELINSPDTTAKDIQNFCNQKYFEGMPNPPNPAI